MEEAPSTNMKSGPRKATATKKPIHTVSSTKSDPQQLRGVSPRGFHWSDTSWMQQRDSRNPLEQPISVYEMHLGSWIHAHPTPLGFSRMAHHAPVPAADMKPEPACSPMPNSLIG